MFFRTTKTSKTTTTLSSHVPITTAIVVCGLVRDVMSTLTIVSKTKAPPMTDPMSAPQTPRIPDCPPQANKETTAKQAIVIPPRRAAFSSGHRGSDTCRFLFAITSSIDEPPSVDELADESDVSEGFCPSDCPGVFAPEFPDAKVEYGDVGLDEALFGSPEEWESVTLADCSGPGADDHASAVQT